MLKYFVACALVAFSVPAFAEPGEVTPYRPTVSNPAALPDAGAPELEFGGALSRNRRDKTSETRFPYLLKYAFSEDLGVLLGGDAYLRARDEAGTVSRGFGDTSVALKLRHALGERLALGVEAGARLPTAKDALGSGKTDYLVNGIASAELGRYDIDLNLGLTRRGRVADGEGRIEIGWAAAAGRPLSGRWGAALELSGAARGGARASSQVLAALAYKASPRLVLDTGVARGLSQGIAWTFFAGLSLMLPSDPADRLAR